MNLNQEVGAQWRQPFTPFVRVNFQVDYPIQGKPSQYVCPCGESLSEVVSKRTNISWKGAKRGRCTVWEGLTCPSIVLLFSPAVLICSRLQRQALLRHDDASLSWRTSRFPFIIKSPYDAVWQIILHDGFLPCMSGFFPLGITSQWLDVI